MKKGSSADVIALNFRLPRKLHKRLEQEAKRNTTSINAEMVERLENSLKRQEWQEDRERWFIALRSAIERYPAVAAKVFRGLKPNAATPQEAIQQVDDDIEREAQEDLKSNLRRK